MARVEYDPEADAAFVHLIEGAVIDHTEPDDDGLVRGVTSDGRIAWYELWSVRTIGFAHYRRLSEAVKDELRVLAQTDGLPHPPVRGQG